MFSTDFIFRQQENLVDNQKCQAGFRPQCNKILLLLWAGKFKLSAQESALASFVGNMTKINIPSEIEPPLYSNT